MRNLIQGHSIGLLGFLMGVVLIISGCGGSNNDSFVATGTPTSASATGSNTGSLTFNFTQAQTVEVPSSTNTLLFEFYDINNNLVFESESSFATSVTVAGIPVSAVRVEITAIDNTGVPLVEVTQEVDVTEDQTTTVDLTTAAVQPVTVASLSISPSTSTLDEGSTVALVVSATYSNNTTITVPNSSVTFLSDSSEIASVSTAGIVTANSPGTANVSAGLNSAPGVSAAVARIGVGNIEFDYLPGGTPTLSLDPNGGGTTGDFEVLFTGPDGNTTRASGSNLALSLAPNTITGLTIETPAPEFAIVAGTTNATANDTLVLSATFISNGVVYNATVNIAVQDFQQS